MKYLITAPDEVAGPITMEKPELKNCLNPHNEKSYQDFKRHLDSLPRHRSEGFTEPEGSIVEGDTLFQIGHKDDVGIYWSDASQEDYNNAEWLKLYRRIVIVPSKAKSRMVENLKEAIAPMSDEEIQETFFEKDGVPSKEDVPSRSQILSKMTQDNQKMGLYESKEDVPERPKIVCLCGSTRFMEAFQEANLRLTCEMNIVLSVGCNTKSDRDLLFSGEMTEELKERLDWLHKRKIDMCDEVFVLNVGGYIGESTRSEIDYALKIGKPVKYLEPLNTNL